MIQFSCKRLPRFDASKPVQSQMIWWVCTLNGQEFEYAQGIGHYAPYARTGRMTVNMEKEIRSVM